MKRRTLAIQAGDLAVRFFLLLSTLDGSIPVDWMCLRVRLCECSLVWPGCGFEAKELPPPSRPPPGRLPRLVSLSFSSSICHARIDKGKEAMGISAPGALSAVALRTSTSLRKQQQQHGCPFEAVTGGPGKSLACAECGSAKDTCVAAQSHTNPRGAVGAQDSFLFVALSFFSQCRPPPPLDVRLSLSPSSGPCT